jgi:hypothetical protein
MKWRTNSFHDDTSPNKPEWEYGNLYLPLPEWFSNEGMDKIGECSQYWGDMMATMPGLADGRGGFDLGWDEDALQMDVFLSFTVERWKEVRKWKPRGNLGLNWGDPLSEPLGLDALT